MIGELHQTCAVLKQLVPTVPDLIATSVSFEYPEIPFGQTKLVSPQSIVFIFY